MIKGRACTLAILSGILAGLSATLFLFSLKLVTDTRLSHPDWVYALPIAGLFIGWIYHVYGREIAPGTNLIIDQIHDPKKITPIRMTPLIFTATLITHLFGGSAGREGTAVQMGASLSDQLTRFFKATKDEKRLLLRCGAGAAFGAAIGTPFAGIFFGIEIIKNKKIGFFGMIECALASFVGYEITKLLHAPHTHFLERTEFGITFHTLLWSVIASAFFALLCFTFIRLTHSIEKFLSWFVKIPYLRPFFGGLLLLSLFKGFDLEAYEGLGLETILRAFQEPLPALTFALKLVLTAITLGSGFKGGEFIPLVFIGACGGNFLSYYSETPLSLLTALGAAALFGAAAKTPFTCSIMAIELFGWKIAPLAFLVCYLSFFLSGKDGIYRHAQTTEL